MGVVQRWIPAVLLLVLGETYAQYDHTNRPIIGVLSQHPPDSILAGLEDKNYTSYIAASYVKYLESAGARVVPILINQEDDYYRNLAYSLNGILFPGGSASITTSSGYGAAGKMLYDHALEIYQQGIYLPIWGTCLGFEMLTYIASGDNKWLASCNATNKADSLVLQDGYLDSRLFAQMPEHTITNLRTEEITVNFHKWCITPENFTVSGLAEPFKMLATSRDFDGLEYVALMEHLDLPIFGSQFHPEKNPFEWAVDSRHNSIPHTPQAIDAAQYFANFFVGQARRNNQSFATIEEETAALIYNYDPFYTAATSGFVQCYLFRDPKNITSSDRESNDISSANIHLTTANKRTFGAEAQNKTTSYDVYTKQALRFPSYLHRKRKLHYNRQLITKLQVNRMPTTVSAGYD